MCEDLHTNIRIHLGLVLHMQSCIIADTIMAHAYSLPWVPGAKTVQN
jgi:hypothetical protein